MKTAEHTMKLSNQVKKINDALSRVYGPETRTKDIPHRTRSEFLAHRREKHYKERLKHVMAKEGTVARPGEYPGDLGNVPQSIGHSGLPTWSQKSVYPKEAYLEGPKNGKKVLAQKITEKAFHTTKRRVFAGSDTFKPHRGGFTTSAKDLFNSSFQGFEPEDHPLGKDLPIHPHHTMPTLHAPNPFPKQLTNKALMTSGHYTHVDHIKIGRQLDAQMAKEALNNGQASVN
mmetsp:Transcript_29519/g.57087  ORF Transcript_29519/g.57087 Transcript_29519/m.57087 type:complete len:230 (-) Transcript_29519:132-821(-)